MIIPEAAVNPAIYTYQILLGDVIDRGPDGIALLLEIMEMPNAIMLLGNHEYMMLNAIEASSKLSNEEVKNGYCNELNLWYNNGGDVTHNYLKHIRKDIRQEIFDYVRSLPINLDVTVNGTKYKLVHGSPIENISKNKWNYFKYDSEKEFAVWKRWGISDGVPDGCVLVFGHTPTSHFQRCEKMELLKNKKNAIQECMAFTLFNKFF